MKSKRYGERERESEIEREILRMWRCEDVRSAELYVDGDWESDMMMDEVIPLPYVFLLYCVCALITMPALENINLSADTTSLWKPNGRSTHWASDTYWALLVKKCNVNVTYSYKVIRDSWRWCWSISFHRIICPFSPIYSNYLLPIRGNEEFYFCTAQTWGMDELSLSLKAVGLWNPNYLNAKPGSVISHWKGME